MTKKIRRQVSRQYSGLGKNSRNFWKIIDRLPELEHNELYSLGCALQNLEGYVLKRLRDVKRSAVRKY